MRAKACCWTGAFLVLAGALYLVVHQSGHFGDSKLSVGPLGWLDDIFGEPWPASIGEFGHVVNGKFEEPDWLLIWRANDDADLVGIDPKVLLYGQIVLHVSEFPAGPPPNVRARVQTFRSNGRPLTQGLLVRFVLIASNADSHTYRSEKPMLLIENPVLAGERQDLIAVYSDDNCWTLILAE